MAQAMRTNTWASERLGKKRAMRSASQLHERHEAGDFDTQTADKLKPAA